jgi:hypothetical protein
VRVITADGGTNGQNGNITVQDTTTAAGDATLELHAQGNITFDPGASITNGGNVLGVSLFAGTNGPAGAPGTILSTITMDATSSVATGGGNFQAIANGNIQLANVNTGAGALSANTSGGGSITQVGALTVGGTTSLTAVGNDITLSDAANNFTGAVSASGANITLVDANAIDLGTVSATGSLSVTAGTNITDSGTVTVATTTSLTATRGRHHAQQRGERLHRRGLGERHEHHAGGCECHRPRHRERERQPVGDGGDEHHRQRHGGGDGHHEPDSNRRRHHAQHAANNFGGAVSASGTNVTLVDTNAIDLGTVSATGNLSVTAGTNITDSGTVTVGGHHEPDGDRWGRHARQRSERIQRCGVGERHHSHAGGCHGDRPGDGERERQPLGDGGDRHHRQRHGDSDWHHELTATAGDITLNTAANNFGGAVSASGTNVTLVDTNAIDLGTVSATGTCR